MPLRRVIALTVFASCAAAPGAAAPTAVEFQGVTIGSKLRTTPVEFKTKVGLAGGGSLAPGLYDVEVASTGDRSRVMLLFYQKTRKMGETPGTLKLGSALAHPGGTYAECCAPSEGKRHSSNTGNPGGTHAACCAPAEGGAKRAPRYLSFEQIGFTSGAQVKVAAGLGGGALVTIPGAGGASIEAQLPAAH